MKKAIGSIKLKLVLWKKKLVKWAGLQQGWITKERKETNYKHQKLRDIIIGTVYMCPWLENLNKMDDTSRKIKYTKTISRRKRKMIWVITEKSLIKYKQSGFS